MNTTRARLATVPERSQRVLLWHWGNAGAGAKFSYELARELRNVPDIELTICVAEGTELADLAAADPNIMTRTVHTYNGNKFSWQGKLNAALSILRLRRLTHEFRTILIDCQTDVAICPFQAIWDVAAIPVLRRHAKRFILFPHEAKFNVGDRYPFRESVLRWEIANADALIVLSDHVGRSAEMLYKFPADRIWSIPHGAFSFGTAEARPRISPTNRSFRLLFFGHIKKYKGLGHLLDAYRILRNRGVAVSLDIVGSGSLTAYTSQIDGLSDVSITNAFVDEEQIQNAFARADIVILPYIEASQSGVAAAALTAAIPIVATPVGGLKEQVCNGQTGVIAKSIGPEDIACAIQSLIDDPLLYETCSAGALRYSQEKLSWSMIATEVANIVKQVSSRPSRRGHL